MRELLCVIGRVTTIFCTYLKTNTFCAIIKLIKLCLFVSFNFVNNLKATPTTYLCITLLQLKNCISEEKIYEIVFSQNGVENSDKIKRLLPLNIFPSIISMDQFVRYKILPFESTERLMDLGKLNFPMEVWF